MCIDIKNSYLVLSNTVVATFFDRAVTLNSQSVPTLSQGAFLYQRLVITASVRRGMEAISLWLCSRVTDAMIALTAAFGSSVAL